MNAVNACPKDHILVLGIDTNHKLGRSDGSSQNDDGEKRYSSIGNYNITQTNERGIAFKSFLGINELCATKTFFKRKQYASKFCTLQNEFYTTAFTITKQKDEKFIFDAGITKKSVNSDHRAIYVKVSQRTATQSRLA